MKKKFILIKDDSELIVSVKSQVRESIKEELANARGKAVGKLSANSYLTRREVCELFHISSSTLHRWVNNGMLGCYKIGRRSLFKVKEIENALVKLNVEGGLNYAV